MRVIPIEDINYIVMRFEGVDGTLEVNVSKTDDPEKFARMLLHEICLKKKQTVDDCPICMGQGKVYTDEDT